MSDFLETAKVLGLAEPPARIASSLQYLSLVHKGFPVKSLERVAQAVAPGDSHFKYRIVPRATLARLKAKPPKKLSAEQSAVLSRVADVWQMAVRIWKSEEQARQFLYREHPLLDRRRPVDLVLDNEVGAQIVRDVLGRLETGSAA
ncbi:MAG: antitoxin Xre/MbcA/ParS toxin-binding domain-containing protein [Gemmatimonas sp.]